MPSEKKTKNRFQRSKREKGSFRRHAARKPRVFKAVVDKNPKGFAFLIFENKTCEDVFVPPREAERLFPGDRVQVELNPYGKPIRIRVLERRFRELVGRFTPHSVTQKQQGWIIYEKKRTREEIYVPQVSFDVKAGDWVRAKLQFHDKGPFPVTGEILQNYGKELPPSADISMIAAEYGLIEAHSQTAEEEAKRAGNEISQKEIKSRKDLRNLPLITIDGETARDFDDAVYVERNRSGYFLWVAIADVSHYVTEGSALNHEAKDRGTSVYFPERAFHMLPRALSENLCSLKPNVPRLALVAKIEFDRNAKKLGTQVMEAVIQSKRRATYQEIQNEWEKNQNNSQWEYRPHFELYRGLRKVRADRGSIDFELPEAELLVEPNGEVISIKNRARLDSHRLIEEFMIAANESVTEWMMERKWPFVYRIHEEPSLQSLEKFQNLAATVGVKFSIEQSSSPKVMAELVNRLEGHPAQVLLNMSLLRSMKQAIYSASHGIHYGLASSAYTHFTSPIRRYPDLVVHRLIRMVLQAQAKSEAKKKIFISQKLREKLERELGEICDHCSYRERLASDAERESIKIKQVRIIAKHLGDEFDGKIIGMISSGMFVQIENPYVEGMVSVESMADDYYEFNEERMIFYGRRKKRTFKIGDRLRIRVVRSDLERRQIDFSMIP